MAAPFRNDSVNGRSPVNRLIPCLVVCVWLSVSVTSGRQQATAQMVSPQVRYFAPEDYAGSWQVFGIDQDAEGRIYAVVPGDRAVQCFDGSHWERIPMPSPPLSIRSDASGRVFVGHEEGIACLERDPAGQVIVRALPISFEEGDSHSFGIAFRDTDSDSDVTFAGARIVVDIHDGQTRVWRPANGEQFIGRVAGCNYVRRREGHTGVFRVVAERREAVAGLESTCVTWILPTAQADLMVLTLNDVLLLTEGELRRFSEELSLALPEGSSIYYCWPNDDGTLAVGTTNGFYCCDAQGHLEYTVDKSDGLETDVVLSVFQDQSNDLWLSTEVGFAHVAHASREQVITVSNSERQLTDFLFARESSVLVGRRGEPYVLELPSMHQTALPQLRDQTLVGAAEIDERLFVFSADVVSRVEESEVTPVFQRRCTAFAIPEGAGLAALALMDTVVEIAVVHPDREWESVQTIPVKLTQASMKVADNGDIIGISHDGMTITRIRFEDDWHSPATVTYHETPPAQLLQSEVFVMIVSEDGWLDYDPTVENGLPFVPAPCLQRIDHRHADRATFTENADLLVAGDRQIYRYPLDRDSGKYREHWDRRLMAAADLMCEPVEVDGWFCIAHARGLTVCRDDAATIPAPVNLLVTLSGSAIDTASEVPAAQSGSNVRLHFSAPVFAADRLMEYQCRLLPEQDEWSDWSEQTSVDYASLTPGAKMFQVRARVRGQEQIATVRQRFSVIPFWYETMLAKFGCVVLLVLMVGGLIHYRDLRTGESQRRLEAEVDCRTTLLAAANAQLEEKIRQAAAAEKAREQLAARYQESERLESLGAMAGGIAHDFNNLLAVIVMQAELLKMASRGAEIDVASSIGVIESTAETASQLCRQILAASCSSPLENQLISLHDLVRELHPLLRSSVTPHPLDLQLELHADPFCGDASQIKQIILNLVINAREAQTDERAVLKIRTGQCTLAESDMAALRCVGERPQPGDYVWVCVADPGPGLDEETQRRMFDPFYSTKAPGRGLGMATVLQTSSRHRGGVTLNRINGETQFHIYLPVNHSVIPLNSPQSTSATAVGTTRDHGLRVLLVDDEPSVRESASLLLEERDFEVVSAATGEEGLKIFQENPDQIDLAILDISLPGMTGQEVASQLLQQVPELPIVMMSGFSQESVTDEFVTRPTVTFLKKPFRSQGLYSACSTVTASRTG